ncbi:hypothetical protein BCR42DRAFT_413981 [Absidia repens]|uniref:Uncharacterized protein n=1 Tax=Absidia repens TaxID=90262 RepID=A0A1X2IIF0_9FUNG|nr:hypothetical protein BCR42DRAFT_413981 [Absidia repens]
MDQNSVAANGWGVPIPEETSHSRYGSEQNSDEGSDYSEFDSEEEDDDDDYAPLQMGTWGAQPTGAQADVNAIQMPDWNERPMDETPSLTFTSADWGKLCDPKVVIKSGIGSGNLHRKGANYKPVNEQQILNQRLKIGPPIPSGKKKKKRGGKSGKRPPPPPSSRPPPPSGALRPPSSSRRPPLTQSAWGSSLSSTPFWESGGAKASKYAATPSSAEPSKAAPQQTSPGARPLPGAASKWATQPLQENFAPPAPQQQAPAAAPAKRLGTSASKYAPAAPATPAIPAPAAAAAAPVAVSTPTPPPPAAAVHGTISLADNAPVTPPRTTIFQLNIELIPGVSAILPVYETDDYRVLVKEFGAKHHLTISAQAESSFAEKIRLMVAELRNQQAQQ